MKELYISIRTGDQKGQLIKKTLTYALHNVMLPKESAIVWLTAESLYSPEPVKGVFHMPFTGPYHWRKEPSQVTGGKFTLYYALLLSFLYLLHVCLCMSLRDVSFH